MCSNVLLRVQITSQHISFGLILTSAPLKYIFLVFRPLEMSAKKPVPFLRQVVPVRKKVGAAPPQFRTSLSAADTAHIWPWGYCRRHRLLLEDRAGPLESADSDSVSLRRTTGGLEQLQVNLRVCDPDVSRRSSGCHQ